MISGLDHGKRMNLGDFFLAACREVVPIELDIALAEAWRFVSGRTCPVTEANAVRGFISTRSGSTHSL